MKRSRPGRWRITLCEPDVDGLEIKAVSSVLRSRWFTMGEVTQKFERMFARALGCKHAFAVTNGTAALHLANAALGVGPGDEVICPALTFVATANASRYTGAGVVFADSVSPDDLTVDPDDIRKKITPRTKAISVVHYAGFHCRMDDILRIARERGLKVIEDCAHSPLARFPGSGGSPRFLGTLGDAGCFSFFSNKNMTTAEGGMIVTNDDRTADKIRSLRSHGMTALTLERHRGHAVGYDVVDLGYNYRIDEIRAAMGIVQFRKLKRNNARRRKLFALYSRLLKGHPNVTVPFQKHDLAMSTPHIMPILVRENAAAIRERLKESGIQTSKHYDLIPRFSLYRDDGFKSGIQYIENIMTLPLYPGMTSGDVHTICDIVRSENA
jgi:dTDP-4-amino-4,6-dideoxygalactose transaminase